MAERVLDVVFYRLDLIRSDWAFDFPEEALTTQLSQQAEELAKFGVSLRSSREEHPVSVNGYADVLNGIRLRFPSAGLNNLCLGHVIGASPNRDLVDDLRRGINRVVFAPETVEPDGSDKVVCHNCGCGC